MPLSPRMPQRGAPLPNQFIERFADQAANAGLLALSHELRGRTALTESDFAEIECRIAARHAALDRLSIDLEYNRKALYSAAAVEGSEARS